VIPYVDYVTSRKNRNADSGVDPEHEDAIQVPLYELVYHDAVVSGYPPDDPRGLLHGSVPGWWGSESQLDLNKVRRMAKLNQRVGLLEMVNHEFLDKDRRLERTTFSGGTTVTVDWNTGKTVIQPDL
jgi:hypothetical protein